MAEFTIVLKTDNDKLNYVKAYLDSDSKRPLAILGEGGTGKTMVVRRAIENCVHNIVRYDNGEYGILQKGKSDNYSLKTIFINTNYKPEYMEMLKETMDPIFVRFDSQV